MSQYFTLVIESVTGGDPIPVPFDFSSEDDLTVLEGETRYDVLYWKQGYPVIDPFGIDNIMIRFYRDIDLSDRIFEGDPDFEVDNERLDDFVNLDRFTDNQNGTGSVRLGVDLRMIDIMKDRTVYIELVVSQPDP